MKHELEETKIFDNSILAQSHSDENCSNIIHYPF